MNKSHWLTCISPNAEASIRLLCFPYTAGGASIYRFFAHVLPRHVQDNVEIWAVEYPGHGERYKEAPAKIFSDLVQALTPAVMPLFDRKVIFLGYSLGAIIGFETARMVREATQKSLFHLLIAACNAPHLCVVVPEFPDAKTLVAHLCTLGMKPNEQDVTDRWPWYQTVFGLCNTYRYTDAQPLDCPIAVFSGEDDSDIDEAALTAWQEHTTCSPIQLSMIPGQHMFLRHLTFLQRLSEHLHYCSEVQKSLEV